MTGTTVEVGRFGERAAAAHLINKGYKIICTNFRVRRSEIDLVAKFNSCIVFVEVKTSSTHYPPRPSKGQVRRLIYVANSFLVTQNVEAKRVRFDLIRVYTNKNSVKVHHLEDVFDSTSLLI